MMAKAHTHNVKRLAALEGLGVLDTGPEKVYDDITQLTADLCEAPVCLISLVEVDRQWFKSEVGLGISETKIEQSICVHAVAQDEYLEIPDTQADARTLDNTLCQGDKPFRFYAGAILRTLEGWPLGTLCVLDHTPRRLSEVQQRVLKVHAKSVTLQLELTRALIQKVGPLSDAKAMMSEDDKDIYEKTHISFGTLTPREEEIMKLIAGRSGSLSSKQIAQELKISHRTVDHHRANIMAKMKVGSVAELIAVSLRAGIFS